jgi:peptide-methionine (R)-S-oxide reductase
MRESNGDLVRLKARLEIPPSTSPPATGRFRRGEPIGGPGNDEEDDVNGRNRGVGTSVWGLILGVAVLAAPHDAPAAATPQGKAAKKPATAPAAARPPRPQEESLEKVTKPDTEWQRILTPEQFRVLRQDGTEMAFTGKYWNNHKAGTYRCAGCGLTLFDSATKFDSGTGWPSFWQPVDPSHVEIVTDTSHGMLREEVQCARCGGHLGHRFDDGPRPTGQRYCMNSVSLDFTAAKK